MERLDICGDAEPYEAKKVYYRHKENGGVPKWYQRKEGQFSSSDDDDTEFEHLYKWPRYAPAPKPYRVSHHEQGEREQAFADNHGPTPKPGYDRWGLQSEDRRVSPAHYVAHHSLDKQFPTELWNRLHFHVPKKDRYKAPSERSSTYWHDDDDDSSSSSSSSLYYSEKVKKDRKSSDSSDSSDSSTLWTYKDLKLFRDHPFIAKV